MLNRQECLEIARKQDRPSHAELEWIETSKHYGHCQFNIGVELLIRYHPINARLPWVMFYLGSVISVRANDV